MPCCTEPMVEGWPFTVTYRHSGSLQNLSFASVERLNVVVTPAAFRSIGDLRSFVLLLSSPPDQGSMPLGMRAVVRSFTQNWVGPSRANLPRSLYRSGATGALSLHVAAHVLQGVKAP